MDDKKMTWSNDLQHPVALVSAYLCTSTSVANQRARPAPPTMGPTRSTCSSSNITTCSTPPVTMDRQQGCTSHLHQLIATRLRLPPATKNLKMVKYAVTVFSSSYTLGLHKSHQIGAAGATFYYLQPKDIVEMEASVFSAALEGMKDVNSEGKMMTKPFLDVCRNILPVIEKFGPAMVLVKKDISGNISRLEAKYISDTAKYNLLYSMVQVEIDKETAKGSSSCTNGLLWLTRAMDFLVHLFQNLLDHQEWTMPQACSDSYVKTLKKWHGWLASSSFTVAMKLAPDRKKFMEVIAGADDIKTDIEKFCTTFSPLLQENHIFLASVGLDEMKSS